MKPKCWTCKHGMCLKVGGVLDAEAFLERLNPVEEKEDWQTEEEAPSGPVSEVKWYTLCYWKPDGVAAEAVELFDVEECSRHEEKEL